MCLVDTCTSSNSKGSAVQLAVVGSADTQALMISYQSSVGSHIVTE